MDAVSGLFLNALGTDMVTMEEYFPFITKAFDVMQYTAWAVLFLIVVWQLFRAFGGPITEAENPWQLVVRGAIFALLIGYAKPIFMLALDIARAPYTALMDVSMTAEEFTFAGVEQVLSNGLLTIVSTVTVVGPILVLILLIALGWNYFKLLLEAVERYIVVGVLCYTSPLAFCMGGSKATNQVFKSWCRMVGSQLLLLVMNVWFIRGFGGAAISATQDLSDFFGLEDGKYGRAIINNSKNKIILNLEPDEARYVQETLKLTRTEIRAITRFERGEALISSNNKVPVVVKASKLEKEMITTDRAELEAILKERQREKTHTA